MDVSDAFLNELRLNAEFNRILAQGACMQRVPFCDLGYFGLDLALAVLVRFWPLYPLCVMPSLRHGILCCCCSWATTAL